MSTEILRRAASSMRAVAIAATPSPWAHWIAPDDGRLEVFIPNGTMSTETVLEFKDFMDCEECVRPDAGTAEHIVAWQPAVALAVADWLEHEATHWEQCERQKAHMAPPRKLNALAVARAYLGDLS